MKKLNYLCLLLTFAGAGIRAQNLPCSTFEDPAPQGNWVTQYCTDTYANTDSWDGSQCVKLNDNSGPSWFVNQTDYNNIGKLYDHKCICFDYYLVNDGDPSASNPIHPTIYLSDGINTIAFVASATVYEGTTGWIHVCAPIEHCTSSTLPSNADGSWSMGATMTCTDFNNVLDNCNSVGFPTDFTSYQTEEMWIDNVCIKECKNCHTDFEFKPVFNTATGGVYADVFLTTTDPGMIYTVDWGDGAVTGLYVSHVYATPGTYIVCVTEYDQKRNVICRTCFTFCYGKITHDGGIDGGGIQGRMMTPSTSDGIKSMLDKTYYEETFAVFPNPAKDYVEIELPVLNKNSNAVVRIIDIMGKVVSETALRPGDNSRRLKINTEKLGVGIYTVEILNSGKTSTQRLSIAK